MADTKISALPAGTASDTVEVPVNDGGVTKKVTGLLQGISNASNTGVGQTALDSITTGTLNVALGVNAGTAILGGTQNTVIGANAGAGITSGGQNTLIGREAGFSLTTQGGNIFIGMQAGRNAAVSNQLYIENSNSATPLIWGDFSTDDVKINGTFTVEVPASGVDAHGFLHAGQTLPTITSWNQVFFGNGAMHASIGATGAINLTRNVYYDGAYRAVATSFAQRIFFDGSGNIEFMTSASTTADAAIGFSSNFKLFAQGGITVGAPTGGHKGFGTINAGAVYDDDTLLTCYVFDAAIDGNISDAKWDALTPDRNIVVRDPSTDEEIVTTETRLHEDMRKFKARLGGAEDPLDIDKYTNHWKTKRHLTSLPNEVNFDPVAGMNTGKWIQRLIETVEIQAVHIGKLNDRLKAIGA